MNKRCRQILTCLVLASALASPVATITPAHAGKYAEKTRIEQKEIEPPEGRALVYVLRTSRMGSAIYVWTFVDEELLGVTRGRAYAATDLAPGEYVLWSKAENVSATTLVVEAGETYYARQVVLPGFGKARTRIELLNTEEGLEALERIDKVSRVTEAGRAKARTISERLLKLARERAADDRGDDADDGGAGDE